MELNTNLVIRFKEQIQELGSSAHELLNYLASFSKILKKSLEQRVIPSSDGLNLDTISLDLETLEKLCSQKAVGIKIVAGKLEELFIDFEEHTDDLYKAQKLKKIVECLSEIADEFKIHIEQRAEEEIKISNEISEGAMSSQTNIEHRENENKFLRGQIDALIDEIDKLKRELDSLQAKLQISQSENDVIKECILLIKEKALQQQNEIDDLTKRNSLLEKNMKIVMNALKIREEEMKEQEVKHAQEIQIATDEGAAKKNKF